MHIWRHCYKKWRKIGLLSLHCAFHIFKTIVWSQHVHSSKTRFNVTFSNTSQIDINNVRICVISVIGQFRYEVTNESAQRLHVVKYQTCFNMNPLHLWLIRVNDTLIAQYHHSDVYCHSKRIGRHLIDLAVQSFYLFNYFALLGIVSAKTKWRIISL